MIRFHCKNCGQRFKVSDQKAGKKGKCPKCKNIIIVPREAPAPAESVPATSDTEKTEPPSPFTESLLQHDPRLEHIAAPQPAPTQNEQFQTLLESTGLSPIEPTQLPQRKFPWLIDIFLYPANVQGMTFLAIAVLIPLLIRLIALFLCIFGLIFLLFNIVILMYIYWFLAQCVRDSASGNLRAPETMAETPGIGELFWQLLELFACLALCAAPAAVYFGYTRRNDLPFWLIAGCGAFIYPMALLAVIMFDSVNGLNPFTIISSIFSTFFQYCGLVILIIAIIFLYFRMIRLLPPDLSLRLVLSPLIQAFELYLAMVAAHLLGRFYFKYQEKLNWEV